MKCYINVFFKETMKIKTGTNYISTRHAMVEKKF